MLLVISPLPLTHLMHGLVHVHVVMRRWHCRNVHAVRLRRLSRGLVTGQVEWWRCARVERLLLVRLESKHRVFD